ncbi:SMI1/KNR4 family protein [Paenibacillus qinlingensis]|uniref:Knr4/Smi1-like domain-containing protein n=1 Tax=Paenibacillus qinlingensis TaxID=1837343 RepID=A0ABU1NTA0_9BACL|nr:SMI1/KNR4 family protein [Paenibacillus qinlingensis]MDR6550704.1 hypothetical protein [Paenibacillus qinlingensis]
MKQIVYKTLMGLKEHIEKSPTMYVHRGSGHLQPCSFSFYKPTSEIHMMNFVKETGYYLPESYKDFLMINDGALLFKDISEKANGAWHIFGLEDIIDFIDKKEVPENMYVIAKYHSILIYVNSSRVKEGREDYMFVGSTYVPDAEDIVLNFELWFERLVVSQGSFFWDWNIVNALNFKSE